MSIQIENVNSCDVVKTEVIPEKFFPVSEVHKRLSGLGYDDSKCTDIDQLTKLKGILKSGACSERKDRFGNLISEYRKHKIMFRDMLPSSTIADVKMVESYKAFNTLRDPNPISCECLLL